MDTFTQFLPWLQIVVSILLVITILLQQTGTGVGGALGGGDGSGNYRTRRGFERFLFYFTIIIAIIFTGLAIAAIVLR
ncbi:MAG: preprotein translocase subunit SecG [Candidatus Pacebacteria bacterium]|jgi:preprotein translocase subunit SecG|nr:preprotein translocase subunit SecG [Candidatus Paceibacterota bacterium]